MKLFLILLLAAVLCRASEDFEVDEALADTGLVDTEKMEENWNSMDEEDLALVEDREDMDELEVGIKHTTPLSHCELSRTYANAHPFICALDAKQEVQCYGRKFDNKDNSRAPPLGVKFKMISGGWHTVSGITVDGEIKIWGVANMKNNDDCYAYIMNHIPKGNDFIYVEHNICVACAIKKDSSLVCWSNNKQGELNGVPPASEKDFVDVSCSHYTCCALKKTGAIKCWGNNRDNLLLNEPNGKYTSIACGHGTCMLLKVDGTVRIFGNGHHGVYGIPAGLRNVKQISLGWVTPCVVTMNNEIKCWGHNEANKLAIPSGTNFKSIDSNRNTCYMTLDNTLKCLGHNGDGQLKINDAKTKWDDAASNCVAPAYLKVGPGECPVWEQHGPQTEVASIDACRDLCYKYSAETYFTTHTEGGKMQCICYADCDERTEKTGWTVYEVLSTKVADLLLEKDTMLSKREDHVAHCNALTDMYKNRLEFIKKEEQDVNKQRWKMAEVANPQPVMADVAVADSVTPFVDACGGRSFMERIGFLFIGGVLGAIAMHMGNKKPFEEGMPLIEEY